jgi:hypothetical protein
MNILTILLIVLIIGMFGALPTWPHAGLGYGWYPSGGISLLVLVIIILLVLGRI